MLDYLEQNKDITNLSGFRTRATSRYFFEIKTEEDILKLKSIYDIAKTNRIDVRFIGQGTNILFAFDEFDGIIIKNSLDGYHIKDGVLEVNSGESVSVLAKNLSEKEGINFFHAWSGLPGTFGGAIVGNAGCFGLEMKDLLISIKVFDIESGIFFDYNNEQLNFGYRESKFKNQTKYYIVSAKINLKNNLIVDAELINVIRQKQPKGLSCGSFYKNPSGNSAGKLIDDAGLKGYKVGGAFVSKEHANFLMSDNSATYIDILELNKGLG